jgi:hypothetical protein
LLVLVLAPILTRCRGESAGPRPGQIIRQSHEAERTLADGEPAADGAKARKNSQREPAIYEGAWRFDEVKAILKERYGRRFASLTPTGASEYYLLGDRGRRVSTT